MDPVSSPRLIHVDAARVAFGAELVDGLLAVRTSDFGAFSRLVAPTARAAGIRLFEVTSTDDSLESVFGYLVRR